MSSPPTSSFVQLRDQVLPRLLACLPAQVARMGWDRAEIRAHQTDRLRALLAHAAEHSPFHRARLAGLDLAAVGPDDLGALPVMDKSDLMDHFDDVLTDRRITLAGVEAALAAAGDDPVVVPGPSMAFSSGGSSGRRGVFLHDVPASLQFVGSITRGLFARIQATGAPPGGLPIAIVAAASPVHASGMAAPMTACRTLPFHFLAVPATLPLAEIVHRLDELRAPLLFGYPSMLAQLAGRIRHTPSLVISTSETLDPVQREVIRTGFGVPVIDSFASTEGLIGGAAPDQDVLTFAEDGCIVELVDEHDRPVPPGTPSAAVLITVLENLLQPLIRYRLTDSFTRVSPDADGHLQARVLGRCDEPLHFGQTPVHPLALRTVLVHTPDVLDYRVEQTGRGIAVDLVTREGRLDTTRLRSELGAALAAAGVPDADVALREVPALTRAGDTGKLRRFVPLARV